MSILSQFFMLVSENPILVSFLGGFLAGEETVITLAFISAIGVLPLWTVLFFSTLGMFFCDVFFFAIGKSRYAHNLLNIKKIRQGYNKIDEPIEKITFNHPILILFYTKLIYGTRIASLLFLGIKGVSWINFLIVNSLIAILWGILVVFVGWFAGKGFNILLVIFKNIQIGIGVTFICIMLFILVKKWLNKKLTPKQKQ